MTIAGCIIFQCIPYANVENRHLAQEWWTPPLQLSTQHY